MLLWRDAPRIWKAKGYTSHAAAADALEERFGSGKGLGRTSISLLVTTQYEPCSPEVEAFIRHELAIKNEETWARYLAEVANEPPEEGAREPAAEVARPGTATIDT
ncbi:MAG TPA: hypothetical protein VK420_15480, partial [Longimicrobium sp.]|nr:hypothetical protein [Longimicrobium sp.]